MATNHKTAPIKHTWKFFRAGGFNQVSLDTGADLVSLDQLDQKLWVALACPTRGIEFDPKTLDLIDTDKDGRIRAPDIIAASNWAGKCLKNPDDLLKGSPSLPLSAIDDSHEEGRRLFSSARQILTNLGKADQSAITIEDISDRTKIFLQTVFNGDGLIPAESAADDKTKATLTEIMACVGSDPDLSGRPGLNQARLDQFFKEATAFIDWCAKAEAEAAKILPFGESTAAAHATFKAVKGKIDDYFARCRLAAFDPRALMALNREEKEYLTLAAKDLSITAAEIAGFPLARIEVGKPLPLGENVNPAWIAPLKAFQAAVVTPCLGEKTTLTEDEWTNLSGRFSAFEAWSATKPAGTVEKLGLTRLREIVASGARETIAALILKDKALEPEANSIAAVEKLLRLHRDLHKLCNNFVSFRDFYGRRDKAVFQAGTLYLDQRSCDLCILVADPARHALMAGLAGTYLAYCECTRKATGEKIQIAAAFTGGDSDNLMVGRNGVFYDRQGRDWDATITKIIDNPISIRQAFFSPYKKLVRMLEENVAKQAAAADASVNAGLAQTASSITAADKAKAAAATPPKSKFDTGTLAAIGLVLTTLLGAVGSIFTQILGLLWWQIPLAMAGIILGISAPSMIMAWLKLHKRNLGPILDANGWAVNALARINVPFGGSLTQIPSLPLGSLAPSIDPFADKKSPWPKVVAFVLALAVILGILSEVGLLNEWTGGAIGKRRRNSDSQTNTPPASLEKVTNATPPAPAPAAAPAK